MTPLLLPPPDAAAERHLYLWKPAGLPVFPPHHAEGPSVLGWWRAQPQCPTHAFPEGFEGGIAHRLDTATSGLLLVARDAPGLAELRAGFSAHALRKFYVFRSAVGGTKRTVEAPIGHHEKSRRRMVVQDSPRRGCRGRWYPAWSRFTPLHEDPEGWLWQAEIRTGVMHQIRVHALHAGFPLVGDPLYGALGPTGSVLEPARTTGGQAGPSFLLHHALVLFPDGTRSPLAALPDGSAPPLAIGRPDGMV